ncbi:cytochrome P450 [Bombardia bombarda]|uniref:Cytochrome P450 n=1 Tax=Bombardia bombarda TaxID=252184 RepID=A0AA40CDC8_9PEZI|nr:cytochrome P450 [Bombardia bombarda]
MVTVILLVSLLRPSKSKAPPTLKERIPFVSNTIQYLTDCGTFLDRVSETFKTTNTNIVKFYLAGTPAYIVAGTANVQRMLRTVDSLDGNFLNLLLMDKFWGMSHSEIDKFAQDHSGRGKTALPGTEGTPPEQRIWHSHDQLYVEFLSKHKYIDALADSFYRLFNERLDRQSKDEWQTVEVFRFLQTAMTESAIISLFGSQIVDLNPDIIEAYYAFDRIANKLAWGFPKFVQPKNVAARERLHDMSKRHIDSAWKNFDWDGPDADSVWEPHFGSRLSRETAKWFRERGFSSYAAAGHTLSTLFGLNGNTVPITTWALITITRDPVLLQAVREEAESTYVVDPATGVRRIDPQKLVSLPLLQSIYIEMMRMHVSFNITRRATQQVVIDGYVIPKGAIVQTCAQIAHFEEDVWGVEGHPASEFWAYRHVKVADVVDEKTGEVVGQKKQFAMKGRPSSFFPFGGGHVMCPGRHFAKQEIMLAIAIIVTKFDIEFVEWTELDGTRRERQAEDDRRYAGFVAISPDGDMRIRWKRRW